MSASDEDISKLGLLGCERVARLTNGLRVVEVQITEHWLDGLGQRTSTVAWHTGVEVMRDMRRPDVCKRTDTRTAGVSKGVREEGQAEEGMSGPRRRTVVAVVDDPHVRAIDCRQRAYEPRVHIRSEVRDVRMRVLQPGVEDEITVGDEQRPEIPEADGGRSVNGHRVAQSADGQEAAEPRGIDPPVVRHDPATGR